MLNRILAIDTSTNACSVALFYNEKIVSRFLISVNEHSKKILPMIDEILSEVKIKLSELNAIVFSKGPGSFTGIRVGIGISQGLAFGSNLPLIGLSTLMILAEGAYRVTGQSKILVGINAKMSKIFFSKYYRNKNNIWIGEKFEVLISLKEIKIFLDSLIGKWYCAGNCWDIYPELLDSKKIIFSKIIFPCAKDMLFIVRDLLYKNKIIKIEDIKPTYLLNPTI
ncbi:tRNA (adenosine(37)-N6)-threonylcarbamoyltransferase complex dimerization subunit type 1 TsaB [Candidatus Providencia siddallii]|uniref:tRNA threonylcarbamoyladenosine biosynthesis protein TsaB n=1 Tax=Candidatus Providencia siddallii TaxID=1715285 RepID=A0ABM9NPS5_9GAMM